LEFSVGASVAAAVLSLKGRSAPVFKGCGSNG
jgi:hypothetical protein